MTVLFVEVGEDEKHQQGHGPGNQHQTCGNAIHWLTFLDERFLITPVITARLELSLA